VGILVDVYVPISIGELVDKITILKIKKRKISKPDSLRNIDIELGFLNEKYDSLNLSDEIFEMEIKLYNINLRLWDVEDEIRVLESTNSFEEDFINLSRSVYKLNDKRFLLKKEINTKTNSALCEEKSYKKY